MKIERSTEDADYASIDLVDVPTNLNITNIYSDMSALNSEQSYYYRFIATDSCGNVDTSSVGKSIWLDGTAFTTLKNYIEWDNGYIQYGTVLKYRVYRQPNAAPLIVVNPAINFYEEDVSHLVGDTGTLCYLVEAAIAMHFPDGTTDTVYSRSNVKCLDQIIKILVPNAFAPEGKNKIFKPVLRFTGNKSYQFEVYNRWGGLIFSTKDFNKGWDGTYNGKLVAQGVYVYVIQVVDSNGKNTEKKGTVMVLRQ
jgi:gliding motility-associated-like protein